MGTETPFGLFFAAFPVCGTYEALSKDSLNKLSHLTFPRTLDVDFALQLRELELHYSSETLKQFAQVTQLKTGVE